MPCFTCSEHEPRFSVYFDEDSDDPAQLQGQYDPITGSISYIMPPDHLITKNTPGCVQTSRFFELPGEIRNQIYQLVLPTLNYEVAWLSKHDRSLTHWKHKKAPGKWYRDFVLPQCSPQTREAFWAAFFTKPAWDPSYQTRRRREMRWPFRGRHMPHSILDPVKGPAALLRVSKQIHDEAAQIFYSQCLFSFERYNILDMFHRWLTPVAKQSLTRLSLAHKGYREPQDYEKIGWKDKHDNAWAERIKAIVKDFPSTLLPHSIKPTYPRTLTPHPTDLQELHLYIHIFDEPPGIDMTARWAEPLKPLAGLHALQTLEVELKVDKWTTKNNDKLRLAAECVKKYVLGPAKFDGKVLRDCEHRLGFTRPPAAKQGGRRMGAAGKGAGGSKAPVAKAVRAY